MIHEANGMPQGVVWLQMPRHWEILGTNTDSKQLFSLNRAATTARFLSRDSRRITHRGAGR